MKKYLVLYRSSESSGEMMAESTPEQRQAGMDAWMAWFGRVGDAVVDVGAPLGDEQQLGSGGAHVTGFTILQADSEDAAVGLLEDHPHLQMPGDSSIEVLEFLPVPGM